MTLRLSDRRKVQKQRTMCPNQLLAPARYWSRNSREEQKKIIREFPLWSREAPQDYMEVLELLQMPT
jgi:hypothetical protein